MRALIARAPRTAETIVDLSGWAGYRLALDVDEAVWGTRDPTESAPSDVILTVIVRDGDRELSHEMHGFCRGARGADGRLPTVTIARLDRFFDDHEQAMVTRPGHWPAGATCHLLLVVQINLPVGLIGEGIR